MKYKIFVDGQTGTTGLEIFERLKKHTEVEMLSIEYEKRRDAEEKKRIINEADIVFLCLPDDAARESVALIDNNTTKVIDASTAHRTHNDWVYGIPELSKQRELIKNAKRVSNPGCHATGFVVSIAPLVQAGILPADYPLAFHSVTGYSGGGKNLISLYEEGDNDTIKEKIRNNAYGSDVLLSPRHYALTLNHKHLPEMKQHTGLLYNPLFTPILGNFYKGMGITIPLVKRSLSKAKTSKEIWSYLSEYYSGEHFVKVMPYNSYDSLFEGGFNITACNGTNNLELFVFENDENILIMTRFDNLGKGASGAAIQNMNVMLGLDESIGLI